MAQNIYSVEQINKYIANMFRQDYFLNRVAVKGEVSNCKYHPSGHIYFTLKDSSGTLSCVMFAGSRGGLAFPMKNGDHVVVNGSVDIYVRDGRYQLYARQITLQGQGDLYQEYLRLKEELEEMGMFAQEYKQPIPKYISRLGIVTAATGAAVRDIMNITRRRNPYVQMVLYPALVQGEGAAASIAEGIGALDAYGVDTIIVGRGGGSIEDLWAFNEETVARAIFRCSTPVISAVGHETDNTIADFVADLRAPTPSAAAELAVYDYSLLEEQILLYRNRLERHMGEQTEKYRRKMENTALRLERVSPHFQIREKRQRLADGETRLAQAVRLVLERYRNKTAMLAGTLHGLSPAAKLGGGYGYITDLSNTGVRSVEALRKGDQIRVHLQDGQLRAQVTEITKSGRKSDE